MIPASMAMFIIAEEEEQKKRDADPKYEPVYSVGTLIDSSWKDILIGLAIGLSPFYLSAIAILIVRWTT